MPTQENTDSFEKKIIKSRIAQKHDTELNWNKATNFIPKQGEIIVYDIDSTYTYERVKIGDGKTVAKDLPFVTDNYYTKSETDTKLNGKQEQLNTTQLAAVNSGITSDKVTKYDNYQSQINSKYEKPDGGIPESDLSSDIQSSLGKADSAIQSHQKITTGSENGTIAVDGTDVAVKGLKALAYKDSLTKSDVGLGNVDNTSDKEKPISTATQAALDEKQPSLTTAQLDAVNSGITSAKVTAYDEYKAQIDGKYTKPTDGIPKTDLASGVQTSLGKADTALQTHQKIATGSANGTISVDGTDVSVKGLGSLAYKDSLTKSDVGLGLVVNAGQDSTPTANSTNYVTSGGVKNYVDAAISGVSQFQYEVVSALPTASADTMGKIYLVAHSHSSDDGYDEYITLESGTTTKTYSWEKIGNTDIDLSNYVNNLSGTANSGVVTNITKSGNTLTVVSSDLTTDSPVASGESTSFIDTVSQEANGKITATRKSIPNVSTTSNGLMSSADKTKLDSIADNATNVTDGTVSDWGYLKPDNLVGKDGITIDKAADSEKIEISGSGLVPSLTEKPQVTNYGRAYIVNAAGTANSSIIIDSFASGTTLCLRDSNGRLRVATPVDNDQVTNKKYVDDNYANLNKENRFKANVVVQAGNDEEKLTFYQYDGMSVFGSELTSYRDDGIETTASSEKLLFPSTGGTLLTNNGVKTLFGNQSIVGTGEITAYESYLSWGGRNISGNFGPIDASLIPSLGANRLAFMPAAAIAVEYSRDGGSTWSAYQTTDDAKISLFSDINANYVIGADSSTGIDKSKYMVRMTINTEAAHLYTVLNKFAIYLSSNGSTGCYCTVAGRLQSDVTAGTETWKTFADKVSVSGWSGWNIINVSGFTTYGNTPTGQYGQVRFTFGVTSHSSDVKYGGLQIIKILGFGGAGWNTPSTMAAKGRMYTWDASQNVYFPCSMYVSNNKQVATTEYVTNELSKKADLLVNESTVTTVQAGRLYEFGDISNPFGLSIDMDTFKTSNDASQIYFTAAANFDVTLNVSSGVRIIGDGVDASAKKISCVKGNSYYFTFGYTKKGVSIVSNIDANWSEITTA